MSDPELIPAEQAEGLVEGLSYQDKVRVLANVLWDVFGDVDDDGRHVLVPGRTPDKVDVESLVTSLCQEFWPDDGDDEEADDIPVEPIPPDWPVQPLKPGDPCVTKATCGHCGLSWDDGTGTSLTPVPSARCPFEPFHGNPRRQGATR